MNRDEIIFNIRPAAEMEIHTHNVRIFVLADNSPKRQEKRDDAAKAVLNQVVPYLYPRVSAFVWVLLVPGGFAEHVVG